LIGWFAATSATGWSGGTKYSTIVALTESDPSGKAKQASGECDEITPRAAISHEYLNYTNRDRQGEGDYGHYCGQIVRGCKHYRSLYSKPEDGKY
jgi:hypothetical protein